MPSDMSDLTAKFAVCLDRRTLLAAWLLASDAARASSAAQSVLAESDAIRNPSKPFSVTINVLEYRNSKLVDSNTLEVFSKLDNVGGQFRTLARFTGPARDLDKLMLKNGNDMWFFDPASQASIRLSPQQRLLGQASNGDVVTINFARDYQADLIGEEELTDGERVLRKCHKLSMDAISPDVVYHKAEMWVEVSSSRPVKARFLAESGRLLKTAFYRKYQLQLGRERPTEVVIIDGLDSSWVTVIRYSGFVYRDVPDSWLQRDYLPRFKGG
jgi:hypothetical protein